MGPPLFYVGTPKNPSLQKLFPRLPNRLVKYAQKPGKGSPRKAHPTKVSEKEESEIRKNRNSDRFQDRIPWDV